MSAINILEAKTALSRLVASIEAGETDEIVIARNGRPVARLVPLEKRKRLRIGVGAGRFAAPRDLDDVNAEVAHLFAGRSDDAG